MNFNELKRKSFFWLDKLQISRKERIGIAILVAVLAIVFSSTLLLEETVNYRQENYEALAEEFEKRSAALESEQQEQERKYNPPAKVNEPVEQEEVVADEPMPDPDQPIQLVNLNTATLEELMTLNGIGDTYARRIIEYRETNGGFNSVEELVNVKGIGKKRLEKIKPFVKL